MTFFNDYWKDTHDKDEPLACVKDYNMQKLNVGSKRSRNIIDCDDRFKIKSVPDVNLISLSNPPISQTIFKGILKIEHDVLGENLELKIFYHSTFLGIFVYFK